MTRDFDLVRKLLIFLEERETCEPMVQPPVIDGYTEPIVSYHLRLLYEAGFLMGQPIFKERLGNTPAEMFTGIDTELLEQVNVAELTWEGHEFLAKIRSEGTWNKIKGIVTEKGGAIAFAVINQIATALALAAVK